MLKIVFILFAGTLSLQPEYTFEGRGKIDIRILDERMVKVDSSIYASKYEVSNADYRTFLNSIKDNNLRDSHRYDSLLWISTYPFSYQKPMADHYHNKKGGSWDDFFQDCTIFPIQTYKAPDPGVGFCVFMQVIQE